MSLDAVGPTSGLVLRDATAADVPAVSALYNHYVLTSTSTYRIEPETESERGAWLAAHGGRYPVVVAEIGGRLVGWAALSPYKERAAYAPTVENSVYVDEAFQRRGIGRALLEHLIERARGLGYHSIVAGVSADQTASLALHESCGFTRVACLREVGRKFGLWLDVIYLQRML
jgi:phosphinothricin acetyltransferase